MRPLRLTSLPLALAALLVPDLVHSRRPTDSVGRGRPRSVSSRRAVEADSEYHEVFFATGEALLELFRHDEMEEDNGGVARYVSERQARQKQLVAVDEDESLVLRVSPEAIEALPRESVKLVSRERYYEGLFLFDVSYMPATCGVWPALWMTPQGTQVPWPHGGEIDLIEYVHRQSMGMFSVHTGPGCRAGTTGYKGRMAYSLDCDALATDDRGCGFRDVRNGTVGPGANNDGGGIYAVEWDNEVGIKSWFFRRSLIPSDIRSRTPNPASWGDPIMYIATEDCPTATYFAPQNVILDLNLCGTWGSATWNQSMRYAGVSEGSCAARTGFETCEQFVLEHGEALLEAFFKLRSFAYYRTDRALEPSWSEAVELDSGPMM